MMASTRRRLRLPAVAAAIALAALPAPALAQRPDAELKGITTLGVTVDPLGAAATTCGFNRDAIVKRLAQLLTAAGFTVVPHGSEATYLDVSIDTLHVQPGVCVSRFDTTLYTNTTAQLSYQAQRVTARVSLLHAAGLSGGGASGHAAAVLGDIQDQVEQFASRIRAAGR